MTGFTLVELLVALVVMAILVAIAAPAFQGLLERQRLESVAETFLSDLRAASFIITSVRGLDSSGTGSITFTLGSLSAKVERDVLGGVFVCSATGDLGYVTCS